MPTTVNTEAMKRSVKFFRGQEQVDKDLLKLTVIENGLKDEHRLTKVEIEKLKQKTASRKVAIG